MVLQLFNRNTMFWREVFFFLSGIQKHKQCRQQANDCSVIFPMYIIHCSVIFPRYIIVSIVAHVYSMSSFHSHHILEIYVQPDGI